MKLSENRAVNPSLQILLPAGPWLTSGCQCPGQVGAPSASSQTKRSPCPSELSSLPFRGRAMRAGGLMIEMSHNHIRL